MMSVDVCEIDALLDARPIDFAAASVIYREGRHSIKPDGSRRTLGDFARGSRVRENVLGRYERHLGEGWMDGFIRDALDGSGLFAGESDRVRREGVTKGVRDQVLVAWAFHELDAAVEKALRGEFDRAAGAPHNWDEARAYYYGEKPGCAAHATAEQLGREFGTGSQVNDAALAAMNRGLEALLAKDTAGAVRARDEVVRCFTITYIQAAIRASAGIDTAIGQGREDEARVHQAGGWAQFRVVEPLIAGVDPAAAAAVTAVLGLDAKPAKGSGDKVRRALAGTYEALDIRASEVGEYRAR
jgi:hypothetical protein